ncbi:MAG: hypothetical protein M3R47_08795 [Chloroflexota bacterium]|nr:hypothetical protein [Chloroflexota bacterium]
MTNLTKVIIQSLQVQLAYTDTARARHLAWAAKTHNTEDIAMHLEIAESFLQTHIQLSRLLNKYSQPAV